MSSRRHPSETKTAVVDLVTKRVLSVQEASTQYHVARATIYQWLRQVYGKTEFIRAAEITTTERQLETLKNQINELLAERDHFKTTVAYLTRPSG